MLYCARLPALTLTCLSVPVPSCSLRHRLSFSVSCWCVSVAVFHPAMCPMSVAAPVCVCWRACLPVCPCVMRLPAWGFIPTPSQSVLPLPSFHHASNALLPPPEQGLAEHKDELGVPLCPCRHYDDKKLEAEQGFWNCPCVPMRERKVCV